MKKYILTISILLVTAISCKPVENPDNGTPYIKHTLKNGYYLIDPDQASGGVTVNQDSITYYFKNEAASTGMQALATEYGPCDAKLIGSKMQQMIQISNKTTMTMYYEIFEDPTSSISIGKCVSEAARLSSTSLKLNDETACSYYVTSSTSFELVCPLYIAK